MALISEKKKEYLHYINNFRGLAMIFIVSIHCVPITSDYPFQYRLLQIIFGNGSILFIFIAGFLFQFLLPKYSYSDYLKKKFLNVISPYLIMSIPAIILALMNLDNHNLWIEQKEWYSNSSYLTKSIGLIFTGAHTSAYWFIPMIALFYLISPLLKLIDSFPITYIIIIPLAILAVLIGRPINNSNAFQSFIYYLPIYLLGMASCRYRLVIENTLSKDKLLYFLITFVTFSIFMYYYNYLFLIYVQKIVLCLLSITLFNYFKLDSKSNIFNVSAKYSFGIYFFHVYVQLFLLSFIKLIKAQIILEFGVLSFILYLALSFGLSLLLSFSVKKILKKRSRIFIGC